MQKTRKIAWRWRYFHKRNQNHEKYAWLTDGCACDLCVELWSTADEKKTSERWWSEHHVVRNMLFSDQISHFTLFAFDFYKLNLTIKKKIMWRFFHAETWVQQHVMYIEENVCSPRAHSTTPKIMAQKLHNGPLSRIRYICYIAFIRPTERKKERRRTQTKEKYYTIYIKLWNRLQSRMDMNKAINFQQFIFVYRWTVNCVGVWFEQENAVMSEREKNTPNRWENISNICSEIRQYT